MALFFNREAKLVIVEGTTHGWEIPILADFSFSQATNAAEITLNEAALDSAGYSRRGRKMFNDSYAPAEWSFSTYIRPFKSSGSGTGKADDTANNHHAVEEVLWAMMAGTSTYNSTNFDFPGFTIDTTDSDIVFDNSNNVEIGKKDFYFVLGPASGVTPSTSNTIVYKIADCVVNEATIDFDIDGIATINWSGMGSLITEQTGVAVGSIITNAGALAATVTEGISSSTNFIRNRLSNLAITASDIDGTGGNVAYALTLTGGSITINNNITFLTPETLGTVNQPIGHVTGTRSVSGNFTCYLDNAAAAATGSADLFKDLATATGVITNVVPLQFNIGGASGTPRLELNMDQCHLEIPTHNIEDVISLETNFHALPSDIGATSGSTPADELTLKYVGA